MTITALTALFALLNLLFLIFYKIMDTFVHIVYSSFEFLTCLYCTQFFLILSNLLIDLFFFNLFYCPRLVVIHRYYRFDTLIKVSSSLSSSSWGAHNCVYINIPWKVCQTLVRESLIGNNPGEQIAIHSHFLFGGIRLNPQTSKTSESTATLSLALAERWTITEIHRQLICVLT